MTRSRGTIWFIGEARDRELRFCLRELERLCRGHTIELFARIDEIDSADRGDLVVVLQDWTHQYRATEIHRLISLVLPAGRLLCVYGSWCESDGRNAGLWPHAVRVPARCAPERFERELRAMARGDEPLPLTAGRDERFEYNHAEPPAAATPGTRAAVDATDRALRESLEDRLRVAGIHIVPPDDADVLIRARPPGSGDRPETRRSNAQNADQRVICISAMPRSRSESSRGIEVCVPLLANDRQLVEAVCNRSSR